jgi:hypothetical protein
VAVDKADLFVVGWREWIALPQFGIDRLKAKIDTGARTSSLHATNLHSFRRDGQPWARFEVQPNQSKASEFVLCEAPVTDHREIKYATGRVELRVVVQVVIGLETRKWPIEVTLTDRRDMRFRMLLGRTALSRRVLVDPRRSYVTGK